MRTDPLGEHDPAKETWWKVDLLKVSNIYSISILFKNYIGYGMYIFIALNDLLFTSSC